MEMGAFSGLELSCRKFGEILERDHGDRMSWSALHCGGLTRAAALHLVLGVLRMLFTLGAGAAIRLRRRSVARLDGVILGAPLVQRLPHRQVLVACEQHTLVMSASSIRASSVRLWQ